MNTLTLLGLASLVFCLVFTATAWFNSGIIKVGRQTRRQAIVEVWANILIGFSINQALNWLLLPLVGATITLGNNLWLGLIFTTISIVRGYVVRRYADARIHRFAARVVE